MNKTKVIRWLMIGCVLSAGFVIVVIAYVVRVCHIIASHGQVAAPERSPAKHLVKINKQTGMTIVKRIHNYDR